jgi:hypothetical protein
LEIKSHILLRPAWTTFLKFYASHCHWDDNLRQGLANFFSSDWPGTTTLTISASYVAEMTGMHHCTQLLVEMGFCELPAQADSNCDPPDLSFPGD